MRSVRIFLLPPCPFVAHVSVTVQPTVARIWGATRSSADMIICANTCACTETFRRPRTAHLGLFDRIDRISSSHPTYTLSAYSALRTHSLARTQPLAHTHMSMPVSPSFCLFAPRTMYPVASPLRLSTRSPLPCHAGPGLDIYPPPTLARFVAPAGIFILLPCVRMFSVGNVTDPHPHLRCTGPIPLPTIIITLSFSFLRTINLSDCLLVSLVVFLS